MISRTLLALAALLLVTPVPAVLLAVTHQPLLYTEPLILALKLPGRTEQVVGPVSWQDGVQAANLVRLVLTVGDSIAPQTETDAGAVVAPELIPAAVSWAVLLVIQTVLAAVTPLTEGDAAPVFTPELRAAAGRLTAGLVRSVPAVRPAVTAGEVGDTQTVRLAAELRPQAGSLRPALPAVQHLDLLLSLALLHLQDALVAVGDSVLTTHGTDNNI